MKASIFIPCFMDQLYPETGMNMVKVLRKAGVEVDYPEAQTCCGQPAYNAGYKSQSKEVCAKFIKDFSGKNPIVVPSASCAGFIKNYYPKIFENSSLHNEVRQLQKRVFEFSDFMVNILKVEDVGAILNTKAVYHDSCAALRECGIKEEPRKLLSKVRELELVEMENNETCCGFGGTFAVKYEPISAAMADQKTGHAQDTGAKIIVSTDISCLMHLEGYIKHREIEMKTMHIADVLASGWD
jgi:L-lactate dehydrogenase complex protein LldE